MKWYLVRLMTLDDPFPIREWIVHAESSAHVTTKIGVPLEGTSLVVLDLTTIVNAAGVYELI